MHLNDNCLPITFAQITSLDFTYGKTYRKTLDLFELAKIVFLGQKLFAIFIEWQVHDRLSK